MAKSKRKRKYQPSRTAEHSLKGWCARAGVGYSSIFTWPRELWPKSIKIGNRIIPTEEPADWRERIRAMGGIPSRPKRPDEIRETASA